MCGKTVNNLLKQGWAKGAYDHTTVPRHRISRVVADVADELPALVVWLDQGKV